MSTDNMKFDWLINFLHVESWYIDSFSPSAYIDISLSLSQSSALIKDLPIKILIIGYRSD